MTCTKCHGLVVVHHDEARCLSCGKYWFPPEQVGEFCSQGGTCGRFAEHDGLCLKHWTQRMEMVNRGRRAGFKFRR